MQRDSISGRLQAETGRPTGWHDKAYNWLVCVSKKGVTRHIYLALDTLLGKPRCLVLSKQGKTLIDSLFFPLICMITKFYGRRHRIPGTENRQVAVKPYTFLLNLWSVAYKKLTEVCTRRYTFGSQSVSRSTKQRQMTKSWALWRTFKINGMWNLSYVSNVFVVVVLKNCFTYIRERQAEWNHRQSTDEITWWPKPSILRLLRSSERGNFLSDGAR